MHASRLFPKVTGIPSEEHAPPAEVESWVLGLLGVSGVWGLKGFMKLGLRNFK